MFDFDFADDGGVSKKSLWSLYIFLLKSHFGSFTYSSFLATFKKNASHFPQITSIHLQ